MKDIWKEELEIAKRSYELYSSHNKDINQCCSCTNHKGSEFLRKKMFEALNNNDTELFTFLLENNTINYLGGLFIVCAELGNISFAKKIILHEKNRGLLGGHKIPFQRALNIAICKNNKEFVDYLCADYGQQLDYMDASMTANSVKNYESGKKLLKIATKNQ